MYVVVIRRVGGLEKTKWKGFWSRNVIRRVGGLETGSKSPRFYSWYPPHRWLRDQKYITDTTCEFRRIVANDGLRILQVIPELLLVIITRY